MFARSECHKWTPYYLDYVKSELPASQRADLERHLNGCAKCRREVAEYRQALSMADAARQQPHPASQASWQELRWQLEGTNAATRRVRRIPFQWQVAGAGVTLAALTGIAVLTPYLIWHPQSTFSVAPSGINHPISAQKVSRATPPHKDSEAVANIKSSLPSEPVATKPGAAQGKTLPQRQTQIPLRRFPQIARRQNAALGDAGLAALQRLSSGASNKNLGQAAEVNAVQQTPGKISARMPGLAATEIEPPRKPGLMRPPDSTPSQSMQTQSIQEPKQRVLLQNVARSRQEQDDLAFLNAPASTASTPGTGPTWDKTRALEAEVTRLLTDVRQGDSFVTVPLPQIAGKGNSAVRMALRVYQQDKAIVDTRLARKIKLGAKGMAISTLLRQMSEETGITLTATPRVSDDNVTVYCNPRPLRDIMRQLSEHFGFQWQREGEEGAYRYELTQSVRSQLREEEMRNEDQDEALIALDKAMEKYRRFRGLNSTQIREMGKSMKPEDAIYLFPMTQGGWLPANLYFSLSPDDMQTLRNGQPITFSTSADTLARTLPPALRPEILGSFEDVRINPHPGKSGPPLVSHDIPADSLPLTAAKEIVATSELQLDRSQLGTFTLKGDINLSVTTPDGSKDGIGHGITLAEVTSPATGSPQNAIANAKHAHDPDLQPRITIEPKASCKLEYGNLPDVEGISQETGEKCTTGDVLEAIFKATGKDVFGDFYTRLYTPGKVTERNTPLFDALNRLGDTMHARWTRDGGWLTFRSNAWFYDRPKEVPARKLMRWAASRKEHGALTVDDLSEIAQLSNTQLDALTIFQGALARYNLQEWNFARSTNLREHWRFLGQLPADLRHDVETAPGLQCDKLPLALQKRFLPLALYDKDTDVRPGSSEAAKASLHIEYPAGHIPADNPNLKPLMPSNPVIFLYKYGNPEKEYGQRTTIIGPFNAIIGGSEAMTEQRRNR